MGLRLEGCLSWAIDAGQMRPYAILVFNMFRSKGLIEVRGHTVMHTLGKDGRFIVVVAKGGEGGTYLGPKGGAGAGKGGNPTDKGGMGQRRYSYTKAFRS